MTSNYCKTLCHVLFASVSCQPYLFGSKSSLSRTWEGRGKLAWPILHFPCLHSTLTATNATVLSRKDKLTRTCARGGGGGAQELERWGEGRGSFVWSAKCRRVKTQHTVSPTLTATDTTVPGMGDLRNGDMSSCITQRGSWRNPSYYYE